MMNEHCPTCTLHFLHVCITLCIILFLILFLLLSLPHPPPHHHHCLDHLWNRMPTTARNVSSSSSCFLKCHMMYSLNCSSAAVHCTWTGQTKLKHLENVWVLCIYVLFWSYFLFYQFGVNPAWINVYFLFVWISKFNNSFVTKQYSHHQHQIV